MNNEKDVQYLTNKKLLELKEELKTLKDETVPMLAVRIDEAKQLGDLSENAEYHAAREDMAWTQSRLKQLNFIIENAEIIDEENKSDRINIGSHIVVNVGDKDKSYNIVGAQEADPLAGKISNESPLGSTLLGRKKGDIIEFDAPSGKQKFTIVSIN